MKRDIKLNSIYKYYSGETAELILLTNSVNMSTPDSFNDPYDTDVIFNKRDISFVIDALLNYHLDQSFKCFVKEHFSKFKRYQKVLVFLPCLLSK